MDPQEFIRAVNEARPPGLPELDLHTLHEWIQAGMIDPRLYRDQARLAVQILGWRQDVAEKAVKDFQDGLKYTGVRRCQVASWESSGEHDEVIRRAIKERQIWHHARFVDVNVGDEDALDLPWTFCLPELEQEFTILAIERAILLKYRRANIVVPEVPQMTIYIDSVDDLPTDKPAEIWVEFLQKPIKEKEDVWELNTLLGARFSSDRVGMLQDEQNRMAGVLVDWSEGNLTPENLDGLRPQFEKGLYYYVGDLKDWKHSINSQPTLMPVYRFYGWLDYCWFRLIEDIERNVMPRLCEHCGAPLSLRWHSDRRYHREGENLTCYRDRKRLEKQRQRQSV